jgi:uncharacterized integral membrane protein
MLQRIRWYFLILCLLVVLVISFQNQQPVALELLFFSHTVPLTLLILGTAVGSFVLGSLTTLWMFRKRRKLPETTPVTTNGG